MAVQEKVTEEMRRLIASNREGKLTSDQWLAAVFEPITPLLLILTPLIVVLAARSGRTGVLFGLLLGVAGTAWLAVTRMVRYARLPLHYSVMTAVRDYRSTRLYGAPDFDNNGEPVVFKRRYTPKFMMTKGTRYGVYWLLDGNNAPVLLSLSPINHPNALSWKPTMDFEARRARRIKRQQKRQIAS